MPSDLFFKQCKLSRLFDYGCLQAFFFRLELFILFYIEFGLSALSFFKNVDSSLFNCGSDPCQVAGMDTPASKDFADRTVVFSLSHSGFKKTNDYQISY